MAQHIKASVKGFVKRRSKLQLWGAALFVVLFAAVGVLRLLLSSAAPYQLYLSPATNQVYKGSEFTISIRLDPGTAVDGVTATIAFDPAQLMYVSTDTTGSAFPVQLATTAGVGTVTVSRGIFAPSTVSTDSLVANVTFKALAVASPAQLTLSGNTTYAGAYTNPATIGADVTIVDTVVIPDPVVPDTTAPVTTISSPANGTTVRGKAVVNASATDNIKVARTEMLFDNTVVANSASETISYTLNFKSRNIAKGAHTVTVNAYDAAGNVGTKSITVYK